jgi:Flp pilus assembly protein CpaB
LKRSNRLVLLIGALLAVVAFVGIVLILGGQGTTNGPTTQATPPPTTSAVFAKVDIPLGTVVTADMLETRTIDVGNTAPNYVRDPSLIISQVIRHQAKAGTQLTFNFFIDSGNAANVTDNLPRGLRAIAVQVDQVTGVGTLVHTGDTVDVIIALKIQQVAEGRNAQNRPDPNQIINIGAPEPSVKMIIQNLRVVGTLLPPPTGAAAAAQQQPAPSGSAPPAQQPATNLNGQQEIVLVAVTANQAEVIRYAQLYSDPAGPFNAESIALVLRSPQDYVAVDASGSPIVGASPVIPPLEKTDGVILKTLIDKYGVLPPDLLLK